MDLRTSLLVADVAAARRRTNLVLTCVVALGFGVIAAQVLLTPVADAVSGDQPSSFLGQVGEVITKVSTLLLQLLWVNLYERRSFWTVGLRGPRPVQRFLAGSRSVWRSCSSPCSGSGPPVGTPSTPPRKPGPVGRRCWR